MSTRTVPPCSGESVLMPPQWGSQQHLPTTANPNLTLTTSPTRVLNTLTSTMVPPKGSDLPSQSGTLHQATSATCYPMIREFSFPHHGTTLTHAYLRRFTPPRPILHEWISKPMSKSGLSHLLHSQTQPNHCRSHITIFVSLT